LIMCVLTVMCGTRERKVTWFPTVTCYPMVTCGVANIVHHIHLASKTLQSPSSTSAKNTAQGVHAGGTTTANKRSGKSGMPLTLRQGKLPRKPYAPLFAQQKRTGRTTYYTIQRQNHSGKLHAGDMVGDSGTSRPYPPKRGCQATR
jgi:hypothetical protein